MHTSGRSESTLNNYSRYISQISLHFNCLPTELQDDQIEDYIVSLVFATREPRRFVPTMDGMIRFGASPRASINLALAAKAHAFLQGRGFVTPQDVKSIAMDVLRHRVITTFEAEADEVSSEKIVQHILETVAVP